MREFVEENLMPYVHEWDEEGSLPQDLPRKFAEAGILAGVVGTPWPTKYANYPIIGGVKHEEVCLSVSYYCFLILLVRCVPRVDSGG